MRCLRWRSAAVNHDVLKHVRALSNRATAARPTAARVPDGGAMAARVPDGGQKDSPRRHAKASALWG
jgi:hypothetical protein